MFSVCLFNGGGGGRGGAGRGTYPTMQCFPYPPPLTPLPPPHPIPRPVTTPPPPRSVPPFFKFFFFLKKAGGAGGMPLAVTQEDCLVGVIFGLFTRHIFTWNRGTFLTQKKEKNLLNWNLNFKTLRIPKNHIYFLSLTFQLNNFHLIITKRCVSCEYDDE